MEMMRSKDWSLVTGKGHGGRRRGSGPAQGDDRGDGDRQEKEGKMVGPPRQMEDSGGEGDMPLACMSPPTVTDSEHAPMATYPCLHASRPQTLGRSPAGLSSLKPPLHSRVPNSSLPAQQLCPASKAGASHTLFPSPHLASSCTSCRSQLCCLKEAFQTPSQCQSPCRILAGTLDHCPPSAIIISYMSTSPTGV